MASKLKPVPRAWRMWAHEYRNSLTGAVHYMHIGPRRYVELHHLKEPVVEVQTIEDPEGTYYGWLAAGEDVPKMIWPSCVQFRMCFPYGVKAAERAGQGRTVRLRLEPAKASESTPP